MHPTTNERLSGCRAGRLDCALGSSRCDGRIRWPCQWHCFIYSLHTECLGYGDLIKGNQSAISIKMSWREHIVHIHSDTSDSSKQQNACTLDSAPNLCSVNNRNPMKWSDSLLLSVCLFALICSSMATQSWTGKDTLWRISMSCSLTGQRTSANESADKGNDWPLSLAWLMPRSRIDTDARLLVYK